MEKIQKFLGQIILGKYNVKNWLPFFEQFIPDRDSNSFTPTYN